MSARLGRRLRPLQVAVGLQGMLLWVPVEKLFMTQIGFTAASVGVMAAAYAAVVPLLEIPSGILADRSSRSWMLVGATVALFASSLLGGLSTNVTMYVLAAMILGVYFAMYSGTVDSIVYDVVLEETGSSTLYERWIGRVRMVESAALVVSALAGGVLAGWASPRVTYFATLPFVVAAVAAFLMFDEPRLHRSVEPVALRSHIALTVRTMTRRPDVVQMLLLAALTGLLSQTIFEFGPLWLVALTAPAVLFGPYWAAMVSTLGLGGYLVAKIPLDRRMVIALLAALSPVTTVVLALTRSLAAVIAAQVLLGLLLAIIGIYAGRLLHDAVPSNIRTAVASGAGTLSWLLFLPFSLVLGWLARTHGITRAAWLLAGASVLAGVLLAATTRHPARRPPEEHEEVACRDFVDLATDYLEGALDPTTRTGFEEHLAGCDGCSEYLAQIETTIKALGGLAREQPG